MQSDKNYVGQNEIFQFRLYVRVPPIKAKLSDHAPNFSKVVVTLVDCKNGLILKFGLNLKWRRAAQKSLNFRR